jgi:hypothetical protein
VSAVEARQDQFLGGLVLPQGIDAEHRLAHAHDVALVHVRGLGDEATVEGGPVAGAEVLENTPAPGQGQPAVEPGQSSIVGHREVAFPATTDDDGGLPERAMDLAIRGFETETDHVNSEGESIEPGFSMISGRLHARPMRWKVSTRSHE